MGIQRWHRSLDLWFRAWRYRTRYERTEIQFLMDHVRPGQTVVDVGSHKGQYIYWMLRAVGSSGQVFAFEPQPELFERLASTRELLGLDNVTLVQAALSRTAGSLVLERVQNRPAPYARIRVNPAHTLPNSFPVDAVALDDFFAERKDRPIDFIKCDAEGHEYEVFYGAKQILARDRPVLLFECEPRHHPDHDVSAVFALLDALKYDGWFIQGDRLEPLERLSGANQVDASRDDYVNNFVFRPRVLSGPCT